MTPSARTRRRAALAGLACAGLAVVTACGSDPDDGTNGVGKLSAGSLDSRARKAAGRADAVRLSGSLASGGHVYRLRMRLDRNGAGGEVATKDGSTFTLLRKGSALYLKADSDFWTRHEKKGSSSASHARAAGKLQGKYVKVPHRDSAYRQLSGFTDMKRLLGGLLSMKGTRAKGPYGTVDGRRTVRVTADKGRGGTLDVSLNGTPYPLRVQRGGHSGTLRLTDWNKDFTLATPKKSQVVDYGARMSGHGR